MTRLRALMAATSLACSACGIASAEEVRPLFTRDLPNADGKTFTVVEVTFAPGTHAEPHRHGQAFVYAYVLSGEIESRLGGEAAHVYHPGDSWFEAPGADHVLTRNVSGSEPARLLAVFVSNTGEPLRTAAAQEGHPMSDVITPPAMGMSEANDPKPAQPAPQQMVNALYSAFGDNHSRAVHAKGIMATGIFEPDAASRDLTIASIFSQGTLPVLVRFSNFTGIPAIPDNVGDANPRGLALKFELPSGGTADVVTHSFNGFPTATTEEFRQLLLAIGSSGPDAPKPTPLDNFLGEHPIAKTFLTTQKPPAQGYGSLSYFGVNAFAWTAPDGRVSFVRYRFVPRDGEVFVRSVDLAALGPNYLQEELPRRLAQGPVIFDWFAQLAEPGDVIGDPSIAWPEDRRLVHLGAVRIDRLVADPAAMDAATMFRPLNVPAGIDPADPMLGVRQAAYPLSFEHRQ